ncbi:pentatricopeptide repeat-containing protein At1g59720, chloroplastic/mitochondrial [Phragmites australis]|uniref:pentatricopeptide repeat-containing protein At1g59720, chloroplastic/mitochondrial n=1 Tax=Phragmites australis TaxID=29695 RepID=UPI002D78D16D|nr:pentatricopeptide repeat-containing protein At1g59720, chloroplastic/mitochondrial [Phragmites australis]
MPSLAASTSSLPTIPPRGTARSSVNLLRSLARSRRADLSHRALLLFRSLHASSSPPPPHFSLPAALSAAAFLGALPEGRQLHALAAKLALAPAHTVVANSLVHHYASCGLPADAIALFRRIPDRSLVSWNTAIDALAGNGDHLGALDLFREMQRDRADLAPDAYTVQSVLGACAGAGALSLGVYAHAMLLRELGAAGDGGTECGASAVSRDVLINNSLVDLYGKCGAVELARQVFDRMPARDLASWNAMILALANHGHVRESLELFDLMTQTENVVPNAITFVAVLSACNHGGLVDEGRRYFAAMTGEYGIRPRIEHYGCMVDILARAGFIEEALRVVAGMNCRPDSIIWRSLLDACCKKNAGLELSEAMAKLALDVPDDAVSGVYVLLSRVYASAQRWNDVGMIRRLMSEEGFKKEPGFSSIEMDGSVHQFVAGDTSHPQSEDIYEKLDEIQQRLTSAGYKPDLSEAPMVAGIDRTKGAALRLHSERLAISFGLLNATPGAPIRILKNLRVCKDCHTISKLISRLYDVEIIVRDRIRFHHFKDGSCSCKDYW